MAPHCGQPFLSAMSVSHVRLSCPSFMSVSHVRQSCPSVMSFSHVCQSCQTVIDLSVMSVEAMSISHVCLSCPSVMSVCHVRHSCLSVMSVSHVRQSCPSVMSDSHGPVSHVCQSWTRQSWIPVSLVCLHLRFMWTEWPTVQHTTVQTDQSIDFHADKPTYR